MLGSTEGGKGKVAVIGFMAGSASTMEREHGFQDEMRKKFPDVYIVGLQFGMGDRAKSMAVTQNVLAAHPDLAGLFADNESSYDGAVAALRSRKAKGVKKVAFDATRAIAMKLRGETPCGATGFRRNAGNEKGPRKVRNQRIANSRHSAVPQWPLML